MKSYKKYFLNNLKAHFSQTFSQMMAEVETHYEYISLDSNFAATSSNPIDRRLDFSAYFLALIQTLDERGEPFERIRLICLEVVTDYVKPKNQLQTLLKKLPVKLMNTGVCSNGFKHLLWFSNSLLMPISISSPALPSNSMRRYWTIP